MTEPIHTDIYTQVLLLGAFQGAFFAFLLMIKHRRRMINQHLAIMLASFGLLLFHQFLIESGYIYQVKALVGFAIPLDILSGPTFYCYIHSITRPDLQKSNYTLWRHYAIVLIPILLLIPFWPLSFETKLALVEGGYSVASWPENMHWHFYAMMGTSTISFSIYIFLSIKLLISHNKRINNVFSYREKVTLKWLTNLLILAFVFWLVAMSFMSVLDSQEDSLTALKMVSFVTFFAVLYIGTMGLLQPRIYHNPEQSLLNAGLDQSLSTLLPSTENDAVKQVPNAIAEGDSGSAKKYLKSVLSIEDMQAIADDTLKIMAEESLYLEADLSMPQLAARLNISPNYLSQTLNSSFEESFFDFINRQRICFAQQQLLDKPSMAVVDVAMAAGFNSKSAFYTAFRKHVDLTPTQFKKNNSLPS